jgi:hypothetical protein
MGHTGQGHENTNTTEHKLEHKLEHRHRHEKQRHQQRYSPYRTSYIVPSLSFQR